MRASNYPVSSSFWTEFWSEGHTTTFGAQLPANYQGELQAHWRRWAERLKDNELVFDLASGNGALPCLLQSISQGMKVNLYANDIAKIHKLERLTQKGITFYEETDSTQIPLPEGSVNHFVSIFGFEYSEMEPTLSEVKRLLKPGGTFNVICHHSQSKVVTEAHQMSELLKQLLVSNVLNDVRQHTLNKSPDKKQLLDRTITKKIQRLKQDFGSAIQFSGLNQLFKKIYTTQLPEQKIVDEITLYTVQCENQIRRLFHLHSSVLNEDSLESFVSISERLGFKNISGKLVKENNDVIGINLSFSNLLSC